MFAKTAWIMVVIMFVSLILVSCGNRGGISAREVRKEAESFNMVAMADKIMDAVKDKDVEMLKGMLSQSILEDIENLDFEIKKLTDFPEGDIADYQYEDAGDTWQKENKQYRIRNKGIIDFHIDTKTYKIMFDYEVVNTYAPNKKGISYLSILDCDTEEILIVQPKSDRFDVGE
jgi:hypothetical protein